MQRKHSKPVNPYRNMEVNISLPLPVNNKSPKHNKLPIAQKDSIELMGKAAVMTTCMLSSKKDKSHRAKVKEALRKNTAGD